MSSFNGKYYQAFKKPIILMLHTLSLKQTGKEHCQLILRPALPNTKPDIFKLSTNQYHHEHRHNNLLPMLHTISAQGPNDGSFHISGELGTMMSCLLLRGSTL